MIDSAGMIGVRTVLDRTPWRTARYGQTPVVLVLDEIMKTLDLLLELLHFVLLAHAYI
jgi:hypothetical protein